jgi:hypothetical protein
MDLRARADAVEREDLEIFIQASLSATGQAEFGEEAAEQALSLGFLHEYMLGTCRPFYARCLALGLNHQAISRIVISLLRAGAPADAEERALEGRLIASALQSLPPQRVYRLARRLRQLGVNNRRTRSTLKAWFQRRDAAFDAVKYGRSLRLLCRHIHLAPAGELQAFLFRSRPQGRVWQTPLFELWRRAHHDQRALLQLPLTVAEGLAARRGIPRERLLKAMAGTMTAAERGRSLAQRLQPGQTPTADGLAQMGLTRLCAYALSLSLEQRRRWLLPLREAQDRCAHRLQRRSGLRLPRVGLVLDRSWSSSGSRERSRHPLALALGLEALLRACADEVICLPTASRLEELVSDRWEPLLAEPWGHTDLATPILQGLQAGVDLLIVVSDGAENSPPGAAAEVLRLARERLGLRPPLLHLNPVYCADSFRLRGLGPGLQAFGIRQAEDLPVILHLVGWGEASDPRVRLSLLAQRYLTGASHEDE